jgi:S1-C subfamily serine protease
MVLTNSHIAEPILDEQTKAEIPRNFLVMNETIGVRQASVLFDAEFDSPVKIDAAVLKIEGAPVSRTLPLNTSAGLDEWIGIAGYPGDAQGGDLRFVNLTNTLENSIAPKTEDIPTAVLDEGRINNITIDLESKAKNLQYTMITAPGNSGSPVVNACGEIVGLHYAGSTTKVKYNVAIHAANVAVFLQLAGVPALIGSEPCQVD